MADVSAEPIGPRPATASNTHNTSIWCGSDSKDMAASTSPQRPQKGKHQKNLSAVILQTDYDSDINYLSDLPAPPAQRTDAELNLSVLQRYNKDTITIEYVAPYAVVYRFSPDSNEWEKSGVEGTAFLCGLLPRKERTHRYAITVLNRRGLENFEFELQSASDIEVTEEYIILQSTENGVPQAYGLWVFSEPPPSSTSHHRAVIAQKIQECAELVQSEKRGTVDQSGPEANGGDDEIEGSVPMGRQLSLKELFGQQRQQDDAWSIRSHSPKRSLVSFANTADTEFFRTPKRHAQPISPAVSAQSNGEGRDALADLFRKAGENYQV